MTSHSKGLPKRDGRKARGALAEQAAAEYLSDSGYGIAARNWRCRSGELDIIAVQDDVIVIVEVRSRSYRAALTYGTAMESVTPRKANQVRSTAAVYLQQAGKSNVQIRFDVIAITFDGEQSIEIEHVKAAF